MYINCLVCYQQLVHVDTLGLVSETETQGLDFTRIFSKFFNYQFDTIFAHFDTSFCPSCSSNVTQIGQNLTKLQELEAEIVRLKGQFEYDLISGYNRSSLSQNDDPNPCDPYFNHRSQLVQGLGLLDCKKEVGNDKERPSDSDSNDFSNYEFEDQNVTTVTGITDEFPIKIDKNLSIIVKKLDLPPGRTSFKLSELKDHYGVKTNRISTSKLKSHVNRVIRRRRKRTVKAKSNIDEPIQFLSCTFNPDCSYRTRSKTRLEAHVNRVHFKNKKHACDQCDFRAGNNALLKYHKMRKHAREKPCICDVCGYRCFLKNELKIHMEIHDGLTYKCETCFSAFPSMYRLKRHQVIHKDMLQSCHICGKLLKSRSLPQHIKLHEDGAKFLCPLCGKIYTTKQSLKFHKLSCENKFDFPCTKCPKKFSYDLQLKKHMRFTHEGFRRSYSCPICQKLVTRKTSLRSHIRRAHTGEKPFKCSFCDKFFVEDKARLWHEKNHNKSEENYKFECTFCGKKFHRSNYLLQHLTRGNPKCMAQEKERKRLLLAANGTI